MIKLLIASVLMISSTLSLADTYSAVSTEDKNVIYLFNDEPCDVFNNPTNLPLKKAKALDIKNHQTVYGCALPSGDSVEFQLISPDQTKLWQFIVPAKDFKRINSI